MQVHLWRLARNEGDVVVLGIVAGAVVVVKESTLTGEFLPQIGALVEPGEVLVVGLVLQDDKPHVLDLAGGRIRRRDGGVSGGVPGLHRNSLGGQGKPWGGG